MSRERTDSKTSRREFLERGIGVGSVGILAGCLGPAPEYIENPSTTALVGHRGCALENPENTVAAVETAARIADAVEVDVRACADGEPVVVHDVMLDRVTSATGSVLGTDCSDVLSATVLDTDETVPHLREIFKAVPADTAIVLDLKVPGIERDAVETSAAYPHDVVFSSNRRGVLKTVRSLDDEVPTAYITRESLYNIPFRLVVPRAPNWLYGPENVMGIVRTASRLGCTAVYPRLELCLQTDLVARAHAAGLRVEPWTVTTRAEFEALEAVGADAVISDVCEGLTRA